MVPLPHSKIVETVEIDGTTITLETGLVARQASGAVVVRQGKAFLLATAVGDDKPRPGIGFFPLTVEYRERMAAAGRIPSSYLRREGRITDMEVLTSRLVDRTLRPLFADGFRCETQVQITVFATDPEADLDSLAIIGAAAAVHLSDLPCEGPVAGLRVSRVDGQLKALATPAERARARLQLIASCRPDGLVMVEGAADGMPESVVLDALDHAAKSVEPLFEAMTRLRERAGRPKRAVTPPETDPELRELVEAGGGQALDAALEVSDKQARSNAVKRAREELVAELCADGAVDESAVAEGFEELLHRKMRERILAGQRIGGRAHDEVRPIYIEVGLLGSNHGSALFTRGETQALVSTTLGGERDAQDRDRVAGRTSESFILHYNFPPYSVGETRPMRGPGRREIGHGNLARRALLPMMPTSDEFPYTVRVVSDITESNGSSSMATVCGGSLALTNGGVPLKAPVAGIAMGLIKEGDEIVILSDILGDEDHLGDMDFKVAGTREAITAVQLDNKLGSLPREVLARALEQAGRGRRHILDEMQRQLDEPRHATGPAGPAIDSIRIDRRKIGQVIGTGGRTIQGIQESTGARVDVRDDGRVFVMSDDPEKTRAAIQRIEAITEDLKVNGVYLAKVVALKDYGAFVSVGEHEGLVHVSELAEQRVNQPSDVVSVGDQVLIRVLGADNRGRLKLSRKAALGVDPSKALNA